MDLEGPIRQPAYDVNGDDKGDESCHPLLFLVLVCVAGFGARRAQAHHQESVKQRDEKDGNEETENEGVRNEDLLSDNGALRRPLYDAGVRRCGAVSLRHVACVHDDRQHDYARHAPDEADSRECIARRPVAHRHDRVAHGQETITAHHGQGVDSREHVDARQHVVDLTHGAAERPVAEQRRRHHERKSDQKEAVGDRQVQDVHVGDGLHLGVSRHDEDDERVADETDGA